METCAGEIENIEQYVAPICPTTGSFIGWKKCRNNRIVKLLITEDALRSSGFGRKCRASKVKVLSIENKDGSIKYEKTYSLWDISFEYKIEETIEINNFDKDRFNECSTGIHFFITREEAEEYDLSGGFINRPVYKNGEE